MEKNFIGFAIYSEDKNNEMKLLEVISGNDFTDYRLAVELSYEYWYNAWKYDTPKPKDIVLCPITPYGKHNLSTPIFNARDINTKDEFNRDKFQEKYYGI